MRHRTAPEINPAQPITVEQLHKATAQLIKQGKGDKRIYLATDDE
jgi:hypothetical protein